MTGLLRSEWIKLTSTKSAYWLYGLAVVLSTAVAVLLGANLEEAEMSKIQIFANSALLLFDQCLVLIAAVVGVTGEYRYGTIRATFLAAPARWNAVLAKTILFAVASAVVTVVTVLVSLLAARLVSGDAGWSPLSGDGLDLLWRYPIYLALGTVAAVGLSLLLRNAAAAISLLLVWSLALESIIPSIPKVGETLADFMPFADGMSWALGTGAHNDWGSGINLLWYAVVCVVLWAAGLLVTMRRDA